MVATPVPQTHPVQRSLPQPHLTKKETESERESTHCPSKLVRKQARPQTSTCPSLQQSHTILLLTQLGLCYPGVLAHLCKLSSTQTCISLEYMGHSLHSLFITGLEMGRRHERSWSIPLSVSRSRCSSHVKLFVSRYQHHLFINQRYGELDNDEGKGGSVELTKD